MLQATVWEDLHAIRVLAYSKTLQEAANTTLISSYPRLSLLTGSLALRKDLSIKHLYLSLQVREHMKRKVNFLGLSTTWESDVIAQTKNLQVRATTTER